MNWMAVRSAYPDQWVVLDVVAARTVAGRRIFDDMVVVATCADGRETMRECQRFAREHQGREYCFAHTSVVELDIVERPWVGVRGHGATISTR